MVQAEIEREFTVGVVVRGNTRRQRIGANSEFIIGNHIGGGNREGRYRVINGPKTDLPGTGLGPGDSAIIPYTRTVPVSLLAFAE